MSKCPFDFTRRSFLALSGGLAASAGAGFLAHNAFDKLQKQNSLGSSGASIIPFFGEYQAGIITPAQTHTYFATFDLLTDKREDVAEILKRWTAASARITHGQTAEPDDLDTNEVATDSGDNLGISPSQLTVTFGFGSGLFIKDGKDRYGLASQRPEAFVDLPKFSGDQLIDARTGGDLSIQACADDPQIAFHAVRQLARMVDYGAKIRWAQSGFLGKSADGGTPRNLMGFKDGSGNPDIQNVDAMNRYVWVGREGPAWMQGGSYLVARRTRIVLEHWDKMKRSFQEQTIGREKISGAPLGMKNEMDAINLDATDKDGNTYIPENSHIRLATAASNDGAKILRRSYSYNDGVNLTAERWPPWHQGMEYDAGLLFICYQRDPRTGFIKIFDKMSKFDMMNQFVTHVGGGMFACPPGAKAGEFIGQRLFQSA